MRGQKLRDDSEYNRSWTYLLPMLEIPRRELDPYLWNLYIHDENRPELDEHLHLLFDTSRIIDNLGFAEVFSGIREHEYFVSDYTPKPGLIIASYRIPEHHKTNYDILMRSKFSRVSDSYKYYLLAYHQRTNGSPLFQILYRSPIKRKQLERDLDCTIDPEAELADVWDEDKEFFKLI